MKGTTSFFLMTAEVKYRQSRGESTGSIKECKLSQAFLKIVA